MNSVLVFTRSCLHSAQACIEAQTPVSPATGLLGRNLLLWACACVFLCRVWGLLCVRFLVFLGFAAFSCRQHRLTAALPGSGLLPPRPWPMSFFVLGVCSCGVPLSLLAMQLPDRGISCPRTCICSNESLQRNSVPLFSPSHMPSHFWAFSPRIGLPDRVPRVDQLAGCGSNKKRGYE